MANNGRQSPARTPKTSTICCREFPPYRLRACGQSDNTSRVSVREKYWFYILTVLAGVSIPLHPNRAATSPIFLPHPVSPPVTSGLQAPLPASTFRHFGLSFCSPIKADNRALGRMGTIPSSPSVTSQHAIRILNSSTIARIRTESALRRTDYRQRDVHLFERRIVFLVAEEENIHVSTVGGLGNRAIREAAVSAE